MAEKHNPSWLPLPSYVSNDGYLGPPVTILWSVWTCRPNVVQIGQELAETHLLFFSKLQQFFKWQTSAILDLWKFKFLAFGRVRTGIVIALTVAEISQF